MKQDTSQITGFSVFQEECKIQNHAKKRRSGQYPAKNHRQIEKNELGGIHKPLDSSQGIERNCQQTHQKKEQCYSVNDNYRKLAIKWNKFQIPACLTILLAKSLVYSLSYTSFNKKGS